MISYESLFTTRYEMQQYMLCLLVWCVCLLNDNMLHFSLKSYDGDIYNNTIILVISGIVALYLAYYFIKKFPPALSLTIAFGIMGFAGFVYPTIH